MLVWRGEPGDLRHAHALVEHVLDATQSHIGLQVIALFTKARVQLTRRQVDEAVEAAREAYRRIHEGPVEEWDEHIRLCLVECLLAQREEAEADQVLRTAFAVIQQRIAQIDRPAYRESFMARNDEVRVLLGLAQERLGLVPGAE